MIFKEYFFPNIFQEQVILYIRFDFFYFENMGEYYNNLLQKHCSDSWNQYEFGNKFNNKSDVFNRSINKTLTQIAF